MSTEKNSPQEEIPTVDLDTGGTPEEETKSAAAEDTTVEEQDDNTIGDADDQPKHGAVAADDGEQDNGGFDWVGEGQHIAIERVSEIETEILLRTHVEETVGLASMVLNPAELRAVYLQLESVIESQNYEAWVAYGNDPAEYQPSALQGFDAEDDEGDEDDDAGRGRWNKVKDPANVESMVGALDAESPVKGMSWKTLVLVGFVALTVISLTISGIS